MPRANPSGRRLVRVCTVLLLAGSSFGLAVPAGAEPAGAAPVGTMPVGKAPRPDSAPLQMPATKESPPRPLKERQGVVPGRILVTLDQGTSVTGGSVPGTRVAARTARTSNTRLNAKLRTVGATSLHPLLRKADPALPGAYVVQTSQKDSVAVARALRGTPGIARVEPDRYVNTMHTGGSPLPSATTRAFAKATRADAAGPAARSDGNPPAAPAADVPGNDTLTNSAQAFLNAGGVNAVGAFSMLQGRYGQQPGAGETITNVSLGDLTDQSMADAGDDYVKSYGPTTVLKDGQRYLDLPSMPLIPAYVAKDSGGLDGAASTKNQDPALGEVLLDFSVMAPLAHDRQRPEATGSGYTDLLGIAPGADYRLVVPEQPTVDRIAGALLAAAHQSPRPSVITASLGFGTDTEGFPGRYLEDDPYIRSVVASIVREGVVVTIASNDGTRLYTPAAVGPDGGSTPTDLAPGDRSATTIDDVGESTTPSRIPDSGAIAAGGTTLDDTLAGGPDGDATTAETRISGSGTFSSGFGSRVDLSAPSDNILAFSHGIGGGAGAVSVSLNGGTSASAPEIAAAAAVVLQSGRLAGHRLTPAAVRQILEATGRPVSTPPQIDRQLHVGPQIDVTAAVQKLIGRKVDTSTDPSAASGPAAPAIVRLSVAHRVTRGSLGGSFLETTDQDRIDLGNRASGGNGAALLGPVTFAGDVTGATGRETYTLIVGSKTFRSDTPAIRLTPTQLLAAAGLPVVADADREITVTYRVLTDGHTSASVTRTLTVGPSDGTHAQVPAPQVPATVPTGKSVTVSYDLTGVTGTDTPQLVLSTVGHWNPMLAPVFSAAWHQELTEKKGTVTIPADAFTGGAGIYGVGIVRSGFGDGPSRTVYGEFAPFRVGGSTASERPDAPTLTGTNGATGHRAEASRANPGVAVHYDVRAVPGAYATELEISAPAPTLFGTVNTFTNVNGDRLDHNGVDSPSVHHQVLTHTSGTTRLNAAELGLGSSNTYGVRVLALDHDGNVIGQASPLSSLTYDDGVAPGGSGVLNFAAAGEHSVAALVTPAGSTELRHYSTATGHYGDVITSDSSENGSYYNVVGATGDRALAVHYLDGGKEVRVETWNTATDTLAGSTTLRAGQDFYLTGRVDPVHNRGVLLLRTDGKDAVLPVDLATGTAGDPVPGDPAGITPGQFTLLTIDNASGQVFLARAAGPYNCLSNASVARIDLDARTATKGGSTSACSHGIASDGAGSLYNLSARVVSVNIVPNASLGALDEQTGTTGSAFTVRKGLPTSLAVDGTNQVAVVSFRTPVGPAYFGSTAMAVVDNNATSQLAVVDLKTGKPIRTLSGFMTGQNGASENAIQLDPKTRTGWTVGPYNEQIQQFSY
ncbi:peptidase S8 [Streptomyces antnestii]|uniref:Peptidase S8 n=1 Tax=Streptomyces antnestii TaxID=2494256 RepID=A0A3S2V4Q0_9ACTN|nr:S8 family serine peptidase [Streptomyces sp. San01]RVU15537.1 peptidase S8 [Streptomyces sp. San01]